MEAFFWQALAQERMLVHWWTELQRKKLSVINSIKGVVKKLPFLRALVADRDRLRVELDRTSESKKDLGFRLSQLSDQLSELQKTHKQTVEELSHNRHIQGFVPPGHFYSPVPDFDKLKQDDRGVFEIGSAEIPGIELNASTQLKLLEKFVPFYSEMIFEENKKKGLRYYYENPAYSYADAILLHCMIRHLEPARIIEVGSGHSSCMTLDTNELHFDNRIDTRFIEPFPDLLHSLIEDSDRERIRVIPTLLQEVDIEEFKKLKANDILFIDSTHVSKIGSDVNRVLFEILPALAPGVYIHFHDIMFPFEYPRDWVFEGRAWNEAYALKAFLQYNRDFSIVLMSTYASRFFPDFFANNMPLCLKNPGGSIWLRKNQEASN